MQYERSKHNIFSRLADSESFFIVNPLSGRADLLDAQTAEEYRSGSFSEPGDWIANGYLVDPAEEEKIYRKAYLDFIEERDGAEIQLFWVPGYACNFACSYCYQSGYTPTAAADVLPVQKTFFEYIGRRFAGRKKYVTVFGGEPLLPGEKQHLIIRDLLERAKEANVSLAFVTNGYSLKDYLPLLKGAPIREIQVTLDGIGETHDRRRPLKGGGSSFEKIIAGIDGALQAGLTVNLRVVLDRENIGDLPGIAALASEHGWTGRPNFKTQLGRNYELHECQKERSRLYDRVGMYADLYRLVLEHPEILAFHKPAFSLSRFLFENGELPDPLFDSCPGTKTEWAFDYTGRIYSCTATVGKAGEELGTFFPSETLNGEKVSEWEERDVTAIPECRDCSLQLACGGGCAEVARNRTGRVLAPDCRPVQELLEMGLSLYFEKLNA